MTEDETFRRLKRPLYKDLLASLNTQRFTNYIPYIEYIKSQHWTLEEWFGEIYNHSPGVNYLPKEVWVDNQVVKIQQRLKDEQ